MLANAERCHICGKTMREFKGVYLCLPCNEKYGDYYNFFTSASKEYHDSNDHVVIECPGATIYDESNSRVVQGVKWHNDESLQGYKKSAQVLSPTTSARDAYPKTSAQHQPVPGLSFHCPHANL
jgi:hypothetical protein